MNNPDMRNMQDHYPHRGDQVEAWIKQRRDDQPQPQDGTRHLIGAAWEALDNLLDEYRLAADTGRSLENMVNDDEGEIEFQLPKRKKKPRV